MNTDTALNLHDDVAPEVLIEIVGDVFEALLGSETGRPILIPEGEPTEPVGAHIRIDGGWRGQLTLRISRPMAEDVASQLFLIPIGEASESEVEDVLGELVNVIGGNVKAMLPGMNALSLPSASLSDLPAPTVGLALSLQWGEETFQIFLSPSPGSP